MNIPGIGDQADVTTFDRPSGWIVTFRNGADYIESRGGVLWSDAPPPPRHHRHKVQTRGSFNGSYAQRCACGAFLDGGVWFYVGNDKPRVQPSWWRKVLSWYRRTTLNNQADWKSSES